MKPVFLANQWIQYCVSTPTQKAVAKIIRESEKPYEGHKNYYDYVCMEYLRKRDFLVESLQAAKLNPTIPEGGFFVIADSSAYQNIPQKYYDEPGPTCESPVTRDWAFARYLILAVKKPFMSIFI